MLSSVSDPEDIDIATDDDNCSDYSEDLGYLDWCCDYHLSIYRDSPRRFYREDGKILSNFASKSLNDAMDAFHLFVKGTIFSNVDKSFVINREIIKFHLVPIARKRFKKYVESFGAKLKYRKLTRNQQNEYKTYKNRKSLVTFCSVKINGNVRDKLMDKNKETFDDFYEMNELSLSYFLHKRLRLPLKESIGWIKNDHFFSEYEDNTIGFSPHKQRKLINEIDSKYLSLTTYLFIQSKKLKIEFVENSKEYLDVVEKENIKKFGKAKCRKITEYFNCKKRKRSNDSISSDDSNKRQRIV